VRACVRACVCACVCACAQTVRKEGVTEGDIVEQIDIGGVTLLRAAAKNFESVLVVCDPADYAKVIEALETKTLTLADRKRFALKAFRHTATYDSVISQWLSGSLEEGKQEVFFFLNALPSLLLRQAKELIPAFILLLCRRCLSRSRLQWTRSKHFVMAKTLTSKVAILIDLGSFRQNSTTWMQLDLQMLCTGGLVQMLRSSRCRARSFLTTTSLTLTWPIRLPRCFLTVISLAAQLNSPQTGDALQEYTDPCVVIIKHNTPCGIATDPESITVAYQKASYSIS